MNPTYSSHSCCRKGDRDESCRSLPSAHLNSTGLTGDTEQLSRHRRGGFQKQLECSVVLKYKGSHFLVPVKPSGSCLSWVGSSLFLGFESLRECQKGGLTDLLVSTPLLIRGKTD